LPVSDHSISAHHPRRIGWLDGVPLDEPGLLAFPGIEILQSETQRTVLKIPPSPARPTLIAKIHRERDPAARLRRFVGWGRARLEWRNLMGAEAGGASVPRPVALACHSDHDVVFSDFLLDTELFPQHLERYRGSRRVAMLRVLGGWLAGVVRAGVDAHDIHTGNILVRGHDADTAHLWLIDLHDARVGLGVPPHRRRAMVRQVAGALGAARAVDDVLHFLQGWGHGARSLGIDRSWARGPDREDESVPWTEVAPALLEETLQAAEASEIQRRRRHISRAFRHRRGAYHQPVNLDGVLQVRRKTRDRRRIGNHSGPGDARAAWFGDRVLQTVWHQKPQATLFIAGRSGICEQVVEKAPAGRSLAWFLREEECKKTVSRCIEAVVATLGRYHHEGIQLEGATPGRWFIEETRDGLEVVPDRSCIRYRGRLSAGMRLADLLQLGAIFDGSVTPVDRLRVLRSHAEFGPLSHSPTALRSLANHLGDLFARSSTTAPEPIRVRGLHSSEGEVDALHRLNQAHVPQLGGLDRPDFEALLRCASLVRVVDAARPEDSAETGPPAAMMVAMRRDDDYDSPNFLWFREGFDNFAYVDRIATAAAARRSGVGSALYAVLEAWARTNEMTSIVCEVNLQPRNQGSIDFHRACGFREVGQKLSHGKPVAMMQKMLTP